MTAQITIDDSINPPVVGTVDLDNSFLTLPFTVGNFDNSGVLGWQWTLVDRPQGSSATLSALFTATSVFTPDVAGSYLIQLQTYTDAARTILDGADEQVAGIRFATPYDWLIPAAGETNQQNATRGWAAAREAAIRDVHAFISSGGHLTETAVKVALYTAKIGERVLYDPSGGTFTINAPAAPALGSHFGVKNTTVDVTAMTISGNGNSLEDPFTQTLVASFSTGALGKLASIAWVFDGTNWVAT